MQNCILTFSTFIFLLISSNLYCQTGAFSNTFHAWNSKELASSSRNDYRREKNHTSDEDSKKEDKEIERELQEEMTKIINELYKQANRLTIELPPYPDPPFLENQIDYIIEYFQKEVGKKIIDTIEYVESEKSRKKKEDEKDEDEIMNIVFDMANKIYRSAESGNPIAALKNLAEDFYFKMNMEYLKEMNYKHYKLVYSEYIHVLGIMNNKKPLLISSKISENEWKALCKSFCSENN